MLKHAFRLGFTLAICILATSTLWTALMARKEQAS